MTSFVYCLTCNQLEPREHSDRIFATGFKRINGIDIPLSTCHRNHLSRAKSSELSKPTLCTTHSAEANITA